MLFEPDGITKIIIGTRINNDFNWYITDKDLWFMDYEKLHNDYKKKFENLKIPYNMDNHEDQNERKGLPILNEISIHELKPRIDKYKVTVDELRELLKMHLSFNSKEDTYYCFIPALYLDFDKKKLYSLYTEYESFETYVAKGWSGKYEDFLSKIELKEKYWYDENGIPILDYSKGVSNA